jgi:hypothetical protein
MQGRIRPEVLGNALGEHDGNDSFLNGADGAFGDAVHGWVLRDAELLFRPNTVQERSELA